jgi:hypothetical protein
VAATVTIPLASMLNGPVVNGVTLVLVVVAARLLNVSFVNAFNAVTTVLFDNSYRWIIHCIDWIVYYNCGCSGITICWLFSFAWFIGNAYVPLEYWLQRLLFRQHQCSMVLSLMALHWYFVVVAATPNVSFVNVFAVTTVLFDTTVTDGSSTASIDFKLLL